MSHMLPLSSAAVRFMQKLGDVTTCGPAFFPGDRMLPLGYRMQDLVRAGCYKWQPATPGTMAGWVRRKPTK